MSLVKMVVNALKRPRWRVVFGAAALLELPTAAARAAEASPGPAGPSVRII